MNLIVRFTRSVTFPTTIRWTTKKKNCDLKKTYSGAKIVWIPFLRIEYLRYCNSKRDHDNNSTTTTTAAATTALQQPFHNSRATQSTQTIQCRKLSYWIFFFSTFYFYIQSSLQKSAASSMVLKGNCLIKKIIFLWFKVKT